MALNNAPIQQAMLNEGFASREWIAFFTRIPKDSFQKVVFVRTKDDLSNVQSDRIYMIDGTVDMDGTSIVVPEGGISIACLNGGRDVGKLVSSADNYTMFTSPVGGYSGDVVMESMTVEVTGANSKVFDLDNDGNSSALDIMGVNFNNCTSLGELTDYRQILMSSVGFVFIDDGLTFNGTWTGIAVISTIAVGFPAATLFKAGTGFTTSNVRSDINFLSTDAASVLFDFSPSHILTHDGMALNGVRTAATNALPNITGDSVKASFSRCNGIRNTYRGGQWTVSTATSTTFSAASTPTKALGTTTYASLDHFTGPANNRFVYAGTNSIDVAIEANISMTGSTNRQITLFFRFYDASAGAFVDDFLSRPKIQYTMNGGPSNTRAEGATVRGYASMDNGDYIELWIQNDTDTTSVQVELGGFVTIAERSS